MNISTNATASNIGDTSPRPILLLLGSQGDHWGEIVSPWIFEYFPSVIFFDSMGSAPMSAGTLVRMQAFYCDAIGFYLTPGQTGISEVCLGIQLALMRFCSGKRLFITVDMPTKEAFDLSHGMLMSVYMALGLEVPFIGQCVEDFRQQIKSASIELHNVNPLEG